MDNMHYHMFQAKTIKSHSRHENKDPDLEDEEEEEEEESLENNKDPRKMCIRKMLNNYFMVHRFDILRPLCSLPILIVIMFVHCFMMVVANNRLPKTAPLPDVFLERVDHYPRAIKVTEVTIVVFTIMNMSLIFFHKQRFVILHRFIVIMGCIYLSRAFFLIITTLPAPSVSNACQRIKTQSLLRLLMVPLRIMFGGGLSINNALLCGDYIFSGHTSMLTMLTCSFVRYTPGFFVVHLLMATWAFFSMTCILLAHEHYSVDVFLALFIVLLIFYTYHFVADALPLLHEHERLNPSVVYKLVYFAEFTFLMPRLKKSHVGSPKAVSPACDKSRELELMATLRS